MNLESYIKDRIELAERDGKLYAFIAICCLVLGVVSIGASKLFTTEYGAKLGAWQPFSILIMLSVFFFFLRRIQFEKILSLRLAQDNPDFITPKMIENI